MQVFILTELQPKIYPDSLIIINWREDSIKCSYFTSINEKY